VFRVVFSGGTTPFFGYGVFIEYPVVWLFAKKFLL
jgi:hypothetical protein